MSVVRAVLRSVGTAACAATVLLSACGGNSDNGDPTTPSGPQPTAIAIAGGNFQLAKYGTSVATAPVVSVTNVNGPMKGVRVTFAAGTGSGSVTGAEVTTDAQGRAAVGGWTLSPAPGVNTLTATAGTLSVTFSATATPGPASSVTVAAGDAQAGVERSKVAAPPSVKVTDGTYAIAGAQVDFVVTSGAGILEAANATSGADGVASLGSWRLGTVGVNTVTATLRGSSLPPVTFTANAAALVVSSFTKVDGDNQAGFGGNFAARRPTVKALNQFSAPAVGVVVNFAMTSGAGTILQTVDTTDETGTATLGSWRYGMTGTQSVTATTPSIGTTLTFTAATTPAPASQFNIEVRFIGATAPRPEVTAAFTAAAAHWSKIIVGDLDDIVIAGTDSMGPFTINEGGTIGTITCIPKLMNQTIDDVVIFADIRPIDGNTGSNILGFATPIYTRDNDSTTVSGCMVFDSANLDGMIADGTLESVITHEMGHVLGAGTFWTMKGITNGTCDDILTTDKPFLTGPSARSAFIASVRTGAVWTDSLVPLEGNGACHDGTRDAHWSEPILDNELMTGYIRGNDNPLSAITAASFRDIGYVVNDLAADPYTLPFGLPAALRSGKGRQLNEMKVNTPIYLVDGRGQTRGIRER